MQMNIEEFNKKIKPLLIIAFCLIVVSSGIVVITMWQSIYKDESINGVVQSVNNNHITLTDGLVIETLVSNLEYKCDPGDRVRINSLELPIAVTCNDVTYTP